MSCSDRGETTEQVVTIQEGLVAAYEENDIVNVIVNFRDPIPESLVNDQVGHREGIRRVREEIIKAGYLGFVPTRHFEHVPAIAGRLHRSALEALSHDPNVSFIQIDSMGHGALTVSVPAIGANVAKSKYRVTGKGVRVAVLDTGVNDDHPDLLSSISPSQHCFTQESCPPGDLSESSVATDDHGHGSHVSGIITSDGAMAGVGFAPDAEIVPVKINDENDSGYVSDWVAGLDWVYANLSTLNVKLINMSICTDQLYSSQSECDASEPALAKSVKALVNAGVTVFAASGNRGSATQMSAPACNSGVIAVGATYKSNQGRQPSSGTYSGQWGSSFGDCSDATTSFDKVACFTNSGPRLDLVAPGAVITSDSLGTSTDQYRGTSQASPTAVGVAALMLECNPKLTPVQVKDILTRTGVTVTDPKNGRSYPSIRAEAAVAEACASAGGASGTGGTSSSGGKTGSNTSSGSVSSTGGTSASSSQTSTAFGGSSVAIEGSGSGSTPSLVGGANNGGSAAAVGGSHATTGGIGIFAGNGALGSLVGGSPSTSSAPNTFGVGGAAAGHSGAEVTPDSSDSETASCSCRTVQSNHRSRSFTLTGFLTFFGLALIRRRKTA